VLRSPGSGALLVVFVGGGGGGGAAGGATWGTDGFAGSAGAGVTMTGAAEALALHFGQTHSTVHLRTGSSLATGKNASLWISRIAQWQHSSWQQPSQSLQQRSGPGTQWSLQWQQYSCLVIVLFSQ
jgi:hypothetical protein